MTEEQYFEHSRLGRGEVVYSPNAQAEYNQEVAGLTNESEINMRISANRKSVSACNFARRTFIVGSVICALSPLGTLLYGADLMDVVRYLSPISLSVGGIVYMTGRPDKFKRAADEFKRRATMLEEKLKPTQLRQ